MAGKTGVASLMMTFREAVFKFEVVQSYNTDDKQVLCDLEYIKDKYVYGLLPTLTTLINIPFTTSITV